MSRWLLPLWAGVLLGCAGERRVPGDERLGDFRFDAERLSAGCELAELDAGSFSFEAVLSREGDGGAYFTLHGLTRTARFDGQVFTTAESAARRFEACGCGTGVQMRESMSFALLSPGQDRALGNGCGERPEDLADGGTVPLDLDAGVLPPASRPEGFDAVRACGVLVDEVLPGEGCLCAACTEVYRLEGVRIR